MFKKNKEVRQALIAYFYTYHNRMHLRLNIYFRLYDYQEHALRSGFRQSVSGLKA